MSKEPAKPLKVTAKLIDGRINSSDGIIMFDGVLYHAWFLKYAPEVFEGGGISEIDILKDVPDCDLPTGFTRRNGRLFMCVGLPIKKHENGTYAASMGVYEQIAETIEYWNKRPDFFASDKINHLDMQKGLVSDSVGLYKAYRTPNVIRTIKDSKIDFYCVGRKDTILELLSHIPAVGKKPSIGWGIVQEWSAEEIDNDYSYIHPEYGLMRPIPIDEVELGLDGYAIMDYAIKPPYWKICNKRRCYVPNATR